MKEVPGSSEFLVPGSWFLVPVRVRVHVPPFDVLRSPFRNAEPRTQNTEPEPEREHEPGTWNSERS
jgi:hypothetical protein